MNHICKYCGKGFRSPHKNRKFCSIDCFRGSRKTGKDVHCKNCLKVFHVSDCDLRRGGGVYCSWDCRIAYMEANKKSRKEIWSKFNSKDSTKIYKRKWAEEKFFGGNRTTIGARCNRCGADNIVLVIHHKDRNKSNNLPTNLEVLCRACHMNEHRKEVVSNEVIK